MNEFMMCCVEKNEGAFSCIVEELTQNVAYILQGTSPILQAQKERDEHSFTIILKCVLAGPLKRHINSMKVSWLFQFCRSFEVHWDGNLLCLY